MITEKEYLEAKKIVQEYEKGFLTVDDIRKMSINTTCPSEEELSKLCQAVVIRSVCVHCGNDRIKLCPHDVYNYCLDCHKFTTKTDL